MIRKELFWSFRIPWNWKTPSTYLAAVCLQCFWLFITASLLVCSLSLFGSCCMAFCTNATDIKDCFLNLKCIESHTNSRISTQNDDNIHMVLFETIRFHAKSIELSVFYFWFFLQSLMNFVFFPSFTKRFSRAYGFNLTAVFLLSSTLLCLVLLNLDDAFQTGNTVDIVRLVVCLSAILINLTVLCLLGYEVTLRFDEIPNSVYSCGWIELPTSIQRNLPILINISQKTVYIEGSFNDRCTREFLKKVIFPRQIVILNCVFLNIDFICCRL